MVYSTCSLNPVENEAVVYNLLLKYKDKLELVDARDKLPGLKTVKGLLTWNLMDKNGEIYDKVEQVGSEYVNLMRPYMFPPELSVAQELNLDRCIRVLPHHQNTGGFFIAVIRKKSKISETSIDSNLNTTNEKLAQAPEKQNSMKAPPAKRQKHMFEENPFKFIDTNNQLLTDWSKIKEFFQISDDFPLNQMMTRNRKDENVKNVYFVSHQIRELTINNLDRFKFINMGVPIFSKAEIKDASNIDLRICQESLDVILKYFKKRIVYIKTYNDLIKILSQSMPSLNELSEELQNQIKEQCNGQPGSLIFTTKSNDPNDELFKLIKRDENDIAISFTAWLGKTCLRPLINVNARSFFMNICGIDEKTISKLLCFI